MGAQTRGEERIGIQCLGTGSVVLLGALKKTGLTTMEILSQEGGKQQQTHRNVLTSLRQSQEASSGLSTRTPRRAMSKAQTRGEERIGIQCLGTGSVVLLGALKKTGLTTMEILSQEEGKQHQDVLCQKLKLGEKNGLAHSVWEQEVWYYW